MVAGQGGHRKQSGVLTPWDNGGDQGGESGYEHGCALDAL